MSKREWRFYLGDMIGFAKKVLAYCDGLDQETFETAGLNYDATVRNLDSCKQCELAAFVRLLTDILLEK